MSEVGRDPTRDVLCGSVFCRCDKIPKKIDLEERFFGFMFSSHCCLLDQGAWLGRAWRCGACSEARLLASRGRESEVKTWCKVWRHDEPYEVP